MLWSRGCKEDYIRMKDAERKVNKMKEYEGAQIKVIEMLIQETLKKEHSTNNENERCRATLVAMINVLGILDYSVMVYHPNIQLTKVRVRKRG